MVGDGDKSDIRRSRLAQRVVKWTTYLSQQLYMCVCVCLDMHVCACVHMCARSIKT
jgi:hypothetical protein